MTVTSIWQSMGVLGWALLASAGVAQADGRLMRLADVHEDRIVFTYENDLWLVPTTGGLAHRITNDPGAEIWAKFSPDGRQLAFTAQYDGNTDVYVMPAEGGQPRRLTYHPAADRVVDWSPDGQSIVFRSNRRFPHRGEELYRVGLTGGLPEPLPVDRAGLASLSPDGQSIAYNRISRESRTWKRHQGGTAQDIWMGSLAKHDYHRVTDFPGSDNFPMWQGDGIYFNSDRYAGTLNLHRYDVGTGKTIRLTNYTDYDVKYPSQGPGAIVFQYGEALHLLNTKTGEVARVPVELPTDLTRMRPEFVSISPRTGSFSLSPTGKRVLLEARGEIINVPAEDGEPINLTQASGSREKNAAWSPNGKWVAFISDRTGEEEIYLVDQKAEKPARQLTHDGYGFRMHLVWSPDSKHLLFADKFLRLNLVDAETGAITVIDQADYDDAWERWGIQDYAWSPDSRWVVYTKMEQAMHDSIFLYSLDTKQVTRVTSDVTQDWSPSFSPCGKYLYFLSNRTFNPTMGFVDQNHVFLDLARPYVLILKAGEPSPFAPKDSEEPVADGDDVDSDEADADDGDNEEEAGDDDSDATVIDLDGLGRRIVAAPGVSAGNYFRLEATKDGFCYLAKEGLEFSKYQTVTDHTGGRLDLYHYDLAERETSKVLDGIANYHISADGKQLIYRAGSTYGVVATGKKAKVGDGKIDYAGVRLAVDRPAEFLQAFDEAWRIQRDWFYDPHLHGLDWAAMRQKYRVLVPYCGNRSDLNYLIGELIGELNIGHTYVHGGDIEGSDYHVPVGLLGATFDAPARSKYYRISHIIPGTPGDPSERSPLAEPGCPIHEGDYLLAVNGAEVTTADNPYAFLQHLSGDVVTLTYNDVPSFDDAQTHRVQTLGSEAAIQYREWVDNNRAAVDAATNGQVGYLHIPNMGAAGLVEFAKAYYPHYYKKAFIIDERYNGGGFTGDMIIDRLERQLWSMTQPREGKPMRDPERCFHGHLVVLVNEDTGSNGEFFAEAVKIKGLAPVIGMRTWGGAIGIEPHQDLVDGGTVTPPQFGLYGLDGTWLIEGHGVDPDIEVQNEPSDVLKGKDAQLEAAIDNTLQRIKRDPMPIPDPPAYPDKSKPVG